MIRNLLTFAVYVMALLVVSGSSGYDCGKVVSDRILKTAEVDSVVMCELVSKLDTFISPEIFGRDFAIVLVTTLEGGIVINRKELYKRVKLLQDVLIEKKGKTEFERFNEGVQSYINGLPAERKMMVYTKIATPEQLGTALRIDRYRGKAEDLITIEEQVNALRDIYDEEDFSSFQKYFNR